MSVNICKVDLLGTISENTNVIVEENNNINRLNLYNEIASLSNPNLLINGDFQVWQRGENFESRTNEVYYVADRWRAYSVKATKVDCGISLQSGQIGENDHNGSIIQPFENLLEPNTYTISVKVKSVTGVVEVYFEKMPDNAIVLHDGINTFTLDVTQKIVTGITIRLQMGASVEIEWVKLEQGLKATPFIPRLYAEELMLCRRYYYKIVYSQYVVTIDDLKTVYLNDSWMNNNMRYPRSIDKTVASGVFIQNGTKIVDDNLESYSYSYGAISFKSSFSSSLTSGVAYFYPKNTAAYFAIDAEIY